MELSKRLKAIAALIDKCSSIADIGTDHGYIPIYAVKEGLCNYAIASDINIGPVKKAEKNILSEGLSGKISCRKGSGLSTVGPQEVDGVIIAGMGGNLIRDILLEDISKVKNLKFLILQPAQNPEVLREFLYNNNFSILQEDLCLDENKYYEMFKVSYHKQAENISTGSIRDIIVKHGLEYEISEILIEKKHPLILDYINYKIKAYNKIASFISTESNAAQKKLELVRKKIKGLEEIIKWLSH